MLLIPTFIAPSHIDGLGVFTNIDIPSGTQIGIFDCCFDKIITEDYIKSLSEIARNFILKYAYRDKESSLYMLNTDNMKYFNHSLNPNIVDVGFSDYAVHPILRGEELTVDYYRFDLDAEKKLK